MGIMGKERIVEQKLKNWVEMGSKNKVWFNVGEERFKIKGSRKKPDLIIWCESIKEYIAVEVKTAETTKNLIGAFKIIDYWKNYCDGTTQYFIDDKQIEIKCFCIASPFSEFGCLLKDDNTIIKTNAPELTPHLIPPLEFRRTKDALRTLWEVWKRFEREPNPEFKQAGIGALLSKSLFNEKLMVMKKSATPLLFSVKYKQTNNGGARWMQEVKTL